jgi:hypothetical protein
MYTSFEGPDQFGGFTSGIAPYTATFSDGDALSQGILEFYTEGLKSWHVRVGTSATVTFETNPSTLSFWVRTPDVPGVDTEIKISDETGAELQIITPTVSFVLVTETRNPGETLIGSVEVTSTSGGDVVIDEWTFGYAGFTGSTGENSCVVAEPTATPFEFTCNRTNAIGELVATAQGTLQIANGNEVSGTGTLHALPGFTLGNGSTVAALTVTAGTIDEGATLDLALDAAGGTTTVSMTPDPNEDYSRGSALATVEGVYTTFDLYGDPSSFVIDAGGLISGSSNANCVLSGAVMIIDPAFNSYDVTLDLASCTGGSTSLNGSYNGLGYTADDQGTDDVFIFSVFNATSTIVGQATM